MPKRIRPLILAEAEFLKVYMNAGAAAVKALIEQWRKKLDERFGKGELRCPACGSTKMLLIRIWSKTAGLVYELTRDGVSPAPVVAAWQNERPLPAAQEQLAFAF